MSLNVSWGGDLATNLFQCFITWMVKSFSWWQIGPSPAAACGRDAWHSLRTQYSNLYTPFHKMLYNVIFSKQTDSHTKFMCKNPFVGGFHRIKFPRLGRRPQPWRLCSFFFLGSSIMHFWFQREVHQGCSPCMEGMVRAFALPLHESGVVKIFHLLCF